jgi:hypothetical protein
VRSVEAHQPPCVPENARTFRWRFHAPYVIAHPEAKEPLRLVDLQADLAHVWSNDSIPRLQSLTVRRASFSYFRRWSYETEGRLNRFVADAGTEIEVTFDTCPTVTQLCALEWGLGEWGESGFGAVRDIIAVA